MTARPSTSPPCLPALPLIGNLLELRQNCLKLLERISARYGDIGAFHFGPMPVPVLNSPELVHNLLVEHEKQVEKTSTVRRLATPVLGHSLFLLEGGEHRERRRLLAPLFQPRQVLNYGEIINKAILFMLERWRSAHTIDLATEMQQTTLQIISEILFGADVAGEERELGEALHLTFRHYAAAVTNPLHFPQNWPTPANRRAQQALARIHSTLDRLLANRLQNPGAHNDFLSLALQARSNEDQLTDADIRAEALALFVAGHETTANALTWSIYLLARNPDIVARLQSAGQQVLGQRLPTVTDLSALPLASQVFQEALRLYPPLYAFTRRAKTSLQPGGYTIPRGSSIVVSPYTLHRRAAIFADPEHFNPDRFAPENAQAIPPHAFIPFGAGPRICLGMHLALLEGHLILASLIQRCSFTLADNTPVEPEPLLTLRPKWPIQMNVMIRE